MIPVNGNFMVFGDSNIQINNVRGNKLSNWNIKWFVKTGLF